MSAKAIGWLPFEALLASSGLIAIASYVTPKQPTHAVKATVVRIAAAGARFPHDIVIAKAPGAMLGQASVSYPYQTWCRIGDEVDAQQTGISLAIDPQTCRRPQISSTSRP